MASKSIGVVILTLNAERHLERLLPPLLNSDLKPKILVVDSSSNDRTQELAREQGIEVLGIDRGDFNHGRTREMARKVIGTDIVVYLTQDAYFIDNHDLKRLVEPLVHDQTSISYARQLPRATAGQLEVFARHFNYPGTSHIRCLNEASKWGAYTFFISNSCAAYLNSALDEIGGFSDVLFGEDTLACAKLLHKGHKVAYVAESKVEHSHDFGLVEEFKRNFDVGLSRKEIAPYLQPGGSDTKRGLAYTKELFITLAKNAPWRLPYAALQILAKWLGYKLGQKSLNASVSWKRALSSQPYYFKQEAPPL